MSERYKTFFGLSKEPFQSNIPIKDILVTHEVKDVSERFKYAVRSGAIAVVTGDVGAGKSTALRWVISGMHHSDFKIIHVTATSGSILEFYRQLVSELDLDLSSNSKAVLIQHIKRCIYELVREKRQQPVIVVDEASLLRLEVFTELHTLTQFECDSKPWLPIIMVGQNILLDRLSFRKSAPLASRVIARSHLSAIGREEMKVYLNHHLKCVGATADIFSEESHTAIFQGSGGILRKANHLARGAMIAASKEKRSTVTPVDVKKASSEIF